MHEKLTGCFWASLSILKTWATFPLALRCMRKLGIAQRVARLIILQSKMEGKKRLVVVCYKYVFENLKFFLKMWGF